MLPASPSLEVATLYQVLDARVLVLIVRIGDRREVYRSTDLRRLRRAVRCGLQP